MVDLGALGGDASNAYAVSEGQVVGEADIGSRDAHGYPVAHAFSWSQAGGMVDLGTLEGYAHSKAVALSSGQIVGQAYDYSPSEGHAVLWTQITTWTPTPGPTKTPTATPKPTATPTITPTPAATSDPSGGGGGCTLTPHDGGVAWWLLVPALVLAWAKRRQTLCGGSM
jgi:probable HAF family extracellular repeat protein